MPSVDILNRLRPSTGIGGELPSGNSAAAPSERQPALPWENPRLKQTTAFIQERLRRECGDLLKSSLLSPAAREEIRLRIRETLVNYPQRLVPGWSVEDLAEAVYDHVAGLGPLQSLVDRPEVSEIMVNRYDDIWVEVEGQLEQMPQVQFRDDQHVFYVAQRILAPIGVSFSAATPLASGRLPGNLRVSAGMPPAQEHCTLNIRKPALPAITTEEYLRRGTASPEMLALLQAAARGRANILIAGPTGTGKSTLLRYLGPYFPPKARLLVLEQVAELGLERYHPHVVAFECQPERPGTSPTYGMEDLLIHALHRRPDYIIVGEVRGPESLQLLMAMATGHPGASTVHAESPDRLFDRIALAILQCRLQVGVEQLLRYLAEAVDLVAYVERMADGTRKITHLAEIAGFRDGNPVLEPLWRFAAEDVSDDRVIGRFERVGALSDRLRRKLARWGVKTYGLVPAGHRTDSPLARTD